MSTPLNGSLMKGFEILRLFSPERKEITAAIVAAELGFNGATAHRFLMTLEQAGALTSFQRGRYGLSLWFEDLAGIAADSNLLGDLSKPAIDQVSNQLNESVMACRLGQRGPVCIAVSVSARPITVNIKVGTWLPYHASAQGKLWLAFMDKHARAQHLNSADLVAYSSKTITNKGLLETEFETIRSEGHALNQGENEPDIGAVSVPVFDRDGQMILSLSAFGMLSRFDAALVNRARSSLERAASELQTRLA